LAWGVLLFLPGQPPSPPPAPSFPPLSGNPADHGE